MSLNTDNIILNNRMTQENLKDKGKSDKSVYIETYGCQMNFSDTEIVLSLMSEFGYTQTMQPEGSDVILINTCSVREHAETKNLQSPPASQTIQEKKSQSDCRYNWLHGREAPAGTFG